MSKGAVSEKYPLDIKDVSPEETADVLKYFKDGYQDEFVRIGPKGYFFDGSFRKMAKTIYDMEIKPDDTWVVTFPRSGTTWVQELVWLVANDFDFAKAKAIPLVKRFPFLEISMFYNSDQALRKWKQVCAGNEELMEQAMTSLEDVVATESPRFLKTHLPLSLLPPRLLLSKVVHVARDPRDVAVSLYYHLQYFTITGYAGDFKTFWNLFINDQYNWTPYFENVKESWEQRKHPNMLFLFYEDILKDLPATVRRVAQFLGRPASAEQVARACDHLRFNNFRNNNSVNFNFFKELGVGHKNMHFVRNGKAGGWRDHFDDELAAQAQRWIDDNLRGTDLRYPTTQME